MPVAVIASICAACTVCQTQCKGFCSQTLSSGPRQPCEEGPGTPITLALPWHTVGAPQTFAK